MAKAKKGKSGSKSGKLPKTIAGVELPKELRKQGGKLLDLVKNPLVGDLVAAGLVALAANVRNQGKSSADDADGKTRSSDAISKTAVTLATVVAARAAEKITSKLTERPAPPANVAPATSDAPPPVPTPARRGRAAKQADANTDTPAPIAATPAPKRELAAKTPRTTSRQPAVKTPRKPRTPKPTS